MSETAATISDLYREQTQGAEPSDEQIEQLLAALAPGEETRALVIALADGTALTWEHLTNHQVTPAAAAIEWAREDQ